MDGTTNREPDNPPWPPPAPRRPRMWPWVIAAVIAAAAFGATITLALTREPTEPAPAAGAGSATGATADPTGLNLPPSFTVPPSLGACDALAGVSTQQILDIGLCDNADGTQEILITAAFDCADGRSIHWNDTGWGWSDGVWQAYPVAPATGDGLLPPDPEMAACLPVPGG